ncbi:MAG: hypothetical protein ACRCY8_11825 [Dermatophilaceae bacterium]
MKFSPLRGLAVVIATIALALGLAAPATAAPVGSGDTAPAQVAGVVLFADAPSEKDLAPDPRQTMTTADGGTITPLVEKSTLNQVSISAKWWGFSIRFSRSETIRIAGGFTACAIFVDDLKLPGAAKTVIKRSCAVMAAVASSALTRGYCLAYNVYAIPVWRGQIDTWDC